MATTVQIAAGKRAAHVTLAANDVTTFTFGGASGVLELLSDGSADVFYTLDGTTPAINGDNSLRIPAGTFSASTRSTTGFGVVDRVVMVSGGTPKVSVQRVG